LLRASFTLFYWVVRRVGAGIAAMSSYFVPIVTLAMAVVFLGDRPQPWQLVVFVPSVLLAVALRFVFGWVVAALAFWTTRIHAVMHLYDRLTFLFAGQIAPLSLLPGPLAALAYARSTRSTSRPRARTGCR